MQVTRIYHNGSALVQTTFDAPYQWYWNYKDWGFYEIDVIAYDNAGLTATAKIVYIFVVNFGFLAPK